VARAVTKTTRSVASRRRRWPTRKSLPLATFHVVDGTRLPFQRILDNLLLVAGLAATVYA